MAKKKTPLSRFLPLGMITLLGPAGLWLLLLLVLPTLVIFELSLVPGIRPGDLVNPSGLDNYLEVFNATYFGVVVQSLFFALGATVICLAMGFPVAYWIARKTAPRWRNLILLGFILPLWTSSLLRSYAWITILRSRGVITHGLQGLYGAIESVAAWPVVAQFPPLRALFQQLAVLDIQEVNILNTTAAVFVGMAYSSLPYMVLILYASLEKLDQRLLEAAADLGANPVEVFQKVTIPQSLPGIAAGSLLVFITSLGDFVNPELLGGASSMTLSRLIYNQFLGASRNWGLGSALSMVLILGVSVAIALLLKYGDRDVAA